LASGIDDVLSVHDLAAEVLPEVGETEYPRAATHRGRDRGHGAEIARGHLGAEVAERNGRARVDATGHDTHCAPLREEATSDGPSLSSRGAGDEREALTMIVHDELLGLLCVAV